MGNIPFQFTSCLNIGSKAKGYLLQQAGENEDMFKPCTIPNKSSVITGERQTSRFGLYRGGCSIHLSPDKLFGLREEMSDLVSRFVGSKAKGRLAEAKAVSYLVENDYEIYLPFSGNSEYDILAVRDGKIYRISVKYTSFQTPSGSWTVTMKNVSRRNHGAVQVDIFEKDKYDYIVVYVGPVDKIVMLNAQRATPFQLTILKQDLDSC